jgi:hypothetical protein
VFIVGKCLNGSAAETEAMTAESIASLPFEKRVCRLGFDCMRPLGYDPLQDKHVPRQPMYGLTPEEIADLVAETGADLWCIDMHNRGVSYASEMVERDPDINPEYIQRMVDRAHEHGICVFATPQLSDVHELDLKGEMDKWKVHSIDDGRDIPVSSRYQSFASAGFADWMGRYLIEHIEMVGVNGFWFDGTPFGPRNAWPWPAGGVGPEAAERYKRDTGHDLPAKEDWNDPNFKRWVRWRYDVTIDCWDKITAVAAKANPDVVPIMNYYTRPDFLWHSGHPMRKIHDSQWAPSLEVEGSMIDKVGRALTPRTETYFWAHGSHVKEIAHGFLPNFDPDRQIAKALRAMAHGLVPHASGMQVDIHLWKDSFKKIFDQLKKRRDYFQGETLKYAAMVVSEQTRDFRREKDPPTGGVGNNANASTFHGIPVLNSLWHVAEGVNGMHNVSHLLLDVIFDDSLNIEDMSKYKIVILDNVACLSKAQCDAIRRYVQNGGTVIAMMETSLYDEWGNPRDNFELADLFGVDYRSTEGRVTRVLVPHDNALKQQFGHFITFVARGTRVALREGTDADLLMARSPVPHVNLLNVKVDPFDSDEPDMVRRRVGKGTVIYSASDLGDGYQLHERRRVADLLTALEREAAPPLIEFDAPAHSVEARAHWKDDNTIVVHIVNMTALYAKHMAPVSDIGIAVNGRRIKRATSPITDRRFEVADNAINVPSVSYGEVVVLEVD